MENRSYDNIEVYQIAKLLADKIWKMVDGWSSYGKTEFGDNLIRSSDTMATSLAQALDKSSFGDRERYAKEARAALFETRHWLRKAYKVDMLTDVEADTMLYFLEKLGQQIKNLIELIESANRFGK